MKFQLTPLVKIGSEPAHGQNALCCRIKIKFKISMSMTLASRQIIALSKQCECRLKDLTFFPADIGESHITDLVGWVVVAALLMNGHAKTSAIRHLHQHVFHKTSRASTDIRKTKFSSLATTYIILQ